MIKAILLILIRFYQTILSPDQGLLAHFTFKRYCFHYPTCSRYSYQMIERYGAIKGIILSIRRVLSCIDTTFQNRTS